MFQSQFESRSWRRLNGGGLLGRFSASNGAAQSVLDSLDGHEGSLSSALLVSLMEHMDGAGLATSENLVKVVSKSRTRDCLPSVKAAEIMLSKDDVRSAAELLSMSSGSREVLHRSFTAARIYKEDGDMANALESALAAHGADPGFADLYPILDELDPRGGWLQRRNIMDIVSGRRPENPAGDGEVQHLYQIYYEWFRGNRDGATDLLISSDGYSRQDPEFMLASARMSVDEKDWHSANMMFSKILDGAPPYLVREAAYARLAGGDPRGAMEMFREADITHPDTMKGMISAASATEGREGLMELLRSYLDSEWAGSEEWTGSLRMLLDMGMEAEAESLLESYTDAMGWDSEALVMKSVLKARSGDCVSALALATEACIRDRKSLSARVQRARVRFMMGRLQAASKEAAAILEADPDNREALILSRDMAVASGDCEKAVGFCRRVLDSDPDSVPAMLDLADALAGTGSGDAAMDMYGKAVRSDGSVQTYVRAVSGLISAGMMSDALYMCRDAEKIHPDSPMLKRLRGNAEYASEDYVRASASYADAIRLDPEDPVLWHSKGMSDEARGDLESAEESYRRALALNPDCPGAWVSLAAVQEARGENASAVEALNRALMLDPGDIHPLVRKAAIFAAEGRNDEAMGFLDLADVRCPGHPAVVAGKMTILNSEGRYGESLRLYSDEYRNDIRISELASECYRATGRAADAPRGSETPETDAPPETEHPTMQSEESEIRGSEPSPEPAVQQADAGSLYTLAASLFEADDTKGAVRAIDEALAIDPAYPPFILLKTDILLASGDPDGAAFLVSSALRENPESPELHMGMGRVRSVKKDHRGALQEYDAAASLGMDDAELHVLRGESLEALGSTDRAIECYSAAFSRDPSRLDVGERLARMMFSRRESMAADGMLNRVLKKDPQRVSAIILKAEIAQSRKDDAGVLAAYGYFVKCVNPGPDATIRMTRILEDTGHSAEARSIVAVKHEEPAGNPVKRNAEKALRRAYTLKSAPDDPEILGFLGLDKEMSEKVSAYIAEKAEAGPIVPGTDDFREMERKSLDAVMKLEWRDLENSPRLPLDAVFVQCGFRDVDDAKKLIAYIHRAMFTDVGRKADPRLIDMSMSLPKGMTVYEIMDQCSIGVYEARVVQSQII